MVIIKNDVEYTDFFLFEVERTGLDVKLGKYWIVYRKHSDDLHINFETRIYKNNKYVNINHTISVHKKLQSVLTKYEQDVKRGFIGSKDGYWDYHVWF